MARIPTLERIIEVLHVVPEGNGTFRGESIEMITNRVYGGQVLAQILMAGAAAVPEKQVKSLHVQFARDGVAPEPVRIVVAVLHDGGTYATCDVRVTQAGRVLADATVSLHVPGEGPAQQSVHRRHTDPLAAKPQRLGLVPCETRVADAVDLRDPEVGPAEFAFWMRSADLEAPIEVHQALVAFASDLTPISTALRAVPGMSQADSHVTVQTAVTAHTLWFHHSIDLRRWVSFEQWAPVTGEGRTFGLGHVFNPSGALVATYAQDAMVRFLRGQPNGAPRTTA